jgi:hypothetical protein
MNMEDFHCDMFDLSLRFSTEDFDKSSFLKEIGVENESEYMDKDGDLPLRVSFGSQEDPPKQHAHLNIIFRAEGSVRATINYHQSATKIVDVKPPYLEDCARWFGGFFKRDELPAHIHIAYEFEEGFTTSIPLPFPLVASSKALSGLKVTGLSFDYPENGPVDSAIIQRQKDGVYLFIQKDAAINLKEFDLYQELKKLTATVATLVKKEKKTNGGSQQKTKV